MSIKAVFGLGNNIKSKNYDYTYHNIGQDIIKFIHQQDKNTLWKKNGIIYKKIATSGTNMVVFYGQGSINNSGRLLAAAKKLFNLENEEILIIYDDSETAKFKIKYTLSGSAKGHNGVRDIIRELNSNHFPRIKVGIGKAENMILADYVLSKLTAADKQQLRKVSEDIFKSLCSASINCNF